MAPRDSSRFREDFLALCLQRELRTRSTDRAQTFSIVSSLDRVISFCHGAFSSHSRRRVLSQIGAVVADGDGSNTDVNAFSGRETRSHNRRSVRTLFGDQRIAFVRYNLRRAFALGILLCIIKQRISE